MKVLDRFGLGLAALGRPAYMTLGHQRDLPRNRSVANVRRHAWAVMDEAWALGIRYFDAARSYGLSEDFLSGWLQSRRIRRGSVTVASKWGYRYVGDWNVRAPVHEVKDHSVAALREQWPLTRERLGRWLTAYQLHSATFATGVLKDRAVLDELARLRDSGVKVGLTVTGADQPELIRAALKIRRGGQPLFSLVQATWNLLEPSAGEALRRAHAAGWTVVIKEPLANGKLTARGPRALTQPLRKAAAEHGVGVDAIALATVLAQPWADVVLLGAATVEQLRSNVAAQRVRLDPAEPEQWLGALAMDPHDYWQQRGALRWS